jgi:hypothetical protein
VISSPHSFSREPSKETVWALVTVLPRKRSSKLQSHLRISKIDKSITAGIHHVFQGLG